ncbi:signal recognition particle-docking protein FtsY [Furfurilactobacillus curtus]|uniref:Signal recognition particle receptor FtsY n=1 Tax=Furfurilactobacillus curtus TaxID=1746200 RepID=A0ABQ5JLU0_9LACO
MGLFDIFRRRKNDESTADATSNSASETPSAVTSARADSAQSLESTKPDRQVETDLNSDATEGISEVKPNSEDMSESTVSRESGNSSASSATKMTPEEVANTNTSLTARQSVADSLSAAAKSSHSQSQAEATVADQSGASERQPMTSSIESVVNDTVEMSDGSAETSSTMVAEDDRQDAAGSNEGSTLSQATDAELYDKGLAKSRRTFGDRLNAFLANFRSVDEDFFDDLEETLIGADVGFNTAVTITDQLRDEVRLKNAKKQSDVENVIIEKLVNLYDAEGNGEDNSVNFAKSGPTVIFFVGVNGVGKTTTVGKMANMYKQQGKKVLLAAADTFRAGAIEQLQVWGQRDDVPVVALPEKSDPAAVVYDAVQRAKEDDVDILMVDTAGRLQNKVNLMNELAKMKRVLSREIPEAPHEVLLVLDATTGQNALNQAKTFGDATDVTGIVLTKLDGTAKGGIVLAIRNELHLPVKFVGLGEQVNDLRPFDPSEFVYGLFKDLITN